MKSEQVVVVGAGIGGLVAAMTLASRGVRVLVLELGEEPGGKAGTASSGGMEFDTGPSLLTLPAVFEQVFEIAGASFHERVQLRDSAHFEYLYPDGSSLRVAPNLDDTLDNVAAAFGERASDELRTFMAYSGRIWASAAPHFVFGDAPRELGGKAFAPSTLAALAEIDALGTMWRSITKRVRDERLRWLLGRYATYNGSDVRRAPATLNCIAHVELALGGYGVQGGVYALIDACYRRAVELGVQFEFGARVERIVLRGDTVVAVRTTEGLLFPASSVVCNADPGLLSDLLGTRKQPKRGSRSTSGWTWVFEGASTGPREAHTVIFPEVYLDEFADLFDHERAPLDPTVYVCDQAAAHGRPGAPLFAMVNAPAVPPAPGEGERLEALVRARLAARGLIAPDAEPAWRRGPGQLAARFPGSEGAIYGAASNSKLDAFRRPPNRLRGLRGLYLASGGAHPGGGLPLCALSGVAAARLVLADLGARVDADLLVDPGASMDVRTTGAAGNRLAST